MVMIIASQVSLISSNELVIDCVAHSASDYKT